MCSISTFYTTQRFGRHLTVRPWGTPNPIGFFFFPIAVVYRETIQVTW